MRARRSNLADEALENRMMDSWESWNEDAMARCVPPLSCLGFVVLAAMLACHVGASDMFASVALSGNGTPLASGACKEDGASTGLAGDQADNGAVDASAVFIL